jgi:hypothetical protein
MRIDRNLFATCSSGLCNRLLVLAGSQRIAELTQRSLALYWPVNEALGCPFDRLFTNRFEMVTEAELGLLLKTNFNVKVYNAWKTEGPTYRTIRRDGDPDAHIVVIKGWSHPRFEDETYSTEIDDDVRRRLLELKPLPEIESAVNEFAPPPATIGVHVRRGDNLENFGQSQDEHFFRIMRGVLERRPDATFFLATDVAAVERRFQDEFGGALLTAPKTWASRREVQGIREGLIDLLLLSRTAALIGNVQSSFSQTAARLGKLEMLLADETNAGAQREESCAWLARCLPQETSVPTA